MTKDPTQLLRIQNAVKQMIANGETTDYIDSFLASQGESPESLHALNTVGPEKLAEVRKRAETPAKPTTGERFRAAGNVIKETGDFLTSMGQEALKDFSAGVLTPAGYEDLKQRVKTQAAEDGPVSRASESVARGLAGAAGMVASPLFRAARIIPGVSKSLMLDAGLGSALYGGTKKAAEGGTSDEVAFDAVTNFLTGTAGGGVAKLGGNFISNITGATSGLGGQTVRDIVSAGNRGSKAFKIGQKMSDSEFADTMQKAAKEVKIRATQELTAGKNALGKTPVDKRLLFEEYQNAYNTPQNISGKTFMGTDETAKVYKAAQNYIRKFDKIKDPTVADIDRLKRNIGSIPADGEALAARTELYNITKNAADTATSGQYSRVMEPYAQTMEVLEDFGRVAKNNPNVSAQTNAILRNMKTEYGRDVMNKVLGSDTYDMVLGKATAPTFTGRTGAVSAATGFLTGNPLTAVAVGGTMSPRVVGETAYKIGKYAPEASEIIKPLSIGTVDLMDALKMY